MKLTVAPVLLALVLLAGCGSNTAGSSSTADAPSKEDAATFLKWSMDKYASFDSFQSNCKWSVEDKNPAKSAPPADRVFTYKKPNQYKAVSKIGPETVTSVSDGKSIVEYGSGNPTGQKYPAPENIAGTMSMLMNHPLFCGTVLYQFFAGSKNYGSLVDETKGKPTLGAVEKAPGGEDAQNVMFYAQGKYGNMQILIGKESGFVYKIKYDNDGLRAIIKALPESERKGEELPDFKTTEVFDNLKKDVTTNATAFDTTPPKGVTVQDQTQSPIGDPNGPPPLPLGSVAPDFQFNRIDGKTTTLASLRGNVVLIDFWATWCEPCREALPMTDKLSQEFKDKGLKVMAVSHESKDVVEKFIKEEGYKFDTCLDPDEKGNEIYKVTALPTTVIIDGKGKIAAYFIGGRPESVIREALSKAGIK